MLMKSNFIVCQDHLLANNLLKRNQRRKEKELEATQQSEKIYCNNEKMKLLYENTLRELEYKGLKEASRKS